MGRLSNSRPCFDRLVRRASARRRAAVAAVGLAVAGPAVAQGPVRVGGEFLINEVPSPRQRHAAVASEPDGDFVVTWEAHMDVGTYGVYSRRYSADGSPRGGDVRVNTFTTGTQRRPDVAVDADGDYVVVWESGATYVGGATQDGSFAGVYGQRYSSAGDTVGAEFQINTTTLNQLQPSVAMDADGGFVVVWAAPGGGSLLGAVYARRYGPSGVAEGGEILIAGDMGPVRASRAEVAMRADGDFVVVWDTGDIFARLCDADGTPRGGAFPVNTLTTGYQVNASVAMDEDGDFLVAWDEYGQDASSPYRDVYAQLFSASGARRGTEFRVNAYVEDEQHSPFVAPDPEGGFLVAWVGRGEGNENGVGVSFQAYDGMGGPRGGNVLASTNAGLLHEEPEAVFDADGDFLLVWDRYVSSVPPFDLDVFGQRFTRRPLPSEPEMPSGFSLAVAPSPVGASGGRVRYETAAPGPVRLSVTDVLGREVAVLADGDRLAGAHEATLDVGRLAPGVYVVRLAAGSASVVRRVTVAR